MEPVRVTLQRMVDAHVPRRVLGRSTGLSTAAIDAILAGKRQQVQRRTAVRVLGLSLAGICADQVRGHVPRVGAVRRV